MAGSSGPQTTTQKSDPWGPQQIPLIQGYNNATNLLSGFQNGQNLQYYPGQTYAGFNGNQTNALNSVYNQGINGGTDAFRSAEGSSQTISANGANNPGSNLLQSTANGDYLSAGNPYFQQQSQRIAGQVLPSIQAPFAGGDRLDSGLATRAASEGLGDAIGNLAYGNYAQERQLQQQAQDQIGTNYTADTGNQIRNNEIAPTLDQQHFSDLNAAFGAGSQFQQNDQNGINAAVARWNYNQQAPWDAAQRYQNLINNNPGGTVTKTEPGGNGTASAIAGIAGLGSAAGSLYSSGVYGSGLKALKDLF